MDADQHPEPASARLVLFPPGSDSGRRRRRTIFAAVYIAVAVMVTWPLYSAFSGTFPLILGLPLSLAWIVLALAVVFFALVWLYRADLRDENPPSIPPFAKGGAAKEGS